MKPTSAHHALVSSILHAESRRLGGGRAVVLVGGRAGVSVVVRVVASVVVCVVASAVYAHNKLSYAISARITYF